MTNRQPSDADPIICGVLASEWPDDELAHLPWTFFIGISEVAAQALWERVRAYRDSHQGPWNRQPRSAG